MINILLTGIACCWCRPAVTPEQVLSFAPFPKPVPLEVTQHCRLQVDQLLLFVMASHHIQGQALRQHAWQ